MEEHVEKKFDGLALPSLRLLTALFGTEVLFRSTLKLYIPDERGSLLIATLHETKILFLLQSLEYLSEVNLTSWDNCYLENQGFT